MEHSACLLSVLWCLYHVFQCHSLCKAGGKYRFPSFSDAFPPFPHYGFHRLHEHLPLHLTECSWFWIMCSFGLHQFIGCHPLFTLLLINQLSHFSYKDKLFCKSSLLPSCILPWDMWITCPNLCHLCNPLNQNLDLHAESNGLLNPQLCLLESKCKTPQQWSKCKGT